VSTATNTSSSTLQAKMRKKLFTKHSREDFGFGERKHKKYHKSGSVETPFWKKPTEKHKHQEKVQKSHGNSHKEEEVKNEKKERNEKKEKKDKKEKRELDSAYCQDDEEQFPMPMTKKEEHSYTKSSKPKPLKPLKAPQGTEEEEEHEKIEAAPVDIDYHETSVELPPSPTLQRKFHSPPLPQIELTKSLQSNELESEDDLISPSSSVSSTSSFSSTSSTALTQEPVTPPQPPPPPPPVLHRPSTGSWKKRLSSVSDDRLTFN